MLRALTLVAALSLLSGCAAVGAGVKHTGTAISALGAYIENTGGDATEKVSEVVKEGAGFLPSPWREAVYGAGAVIGLFGANRGRKKLVKKLKDSKPGELLASSGDDKD